MESILVLSGAWVVGCNYFSQSTGFGLASLHTLLSKYPLCFGILKKMMFGHHLKFNKHNHTQTQTFAPSSLRFGFLFCDRYTEKTMKKSWILVLVLATSFLVSGIFESLKPELSDVVFIIHTFFIAFMLFWWVGVHASEQGIKPPRAAKFLTAMIMPIGLPYYLYRGYGFKSGTVKLIFAFLILLIMAFTYLVPFYLVEWAAI